MVNEELVGGLRSRNKFCCGEEVILTKLIVLPGGGEEKWHFLGSINRRTTGSLKYCFN